MSNFNTLEAVTRPGRRPSLTEMPIQPRGPRRLPEADRPTCLVYLLMASLLVGSLAGPAGASPGDLDSTFGSGGMIITPFTGSVSGASGTALAVQANGKIVVAGTASVEPFRAGDFALARYDSNGNLDPTFVLQRHFRGLATTCCVNTRRSSAASCGPMADPSL